MDKRIWGIIGGLALVLALLSPYVLGSTKKVARLFEAAEMLYAQKDYEGAIATYNEALHESHKFRVNTETIDKDFTTLVNFKIAMSYAKLAEYTDNPIYYEKALEYIEKALQTVILAAYEGNLIYLRGHIFYKTEQLSLAEEVLTQLLANFPGNSFMEEAEKMIVHIRQQQELSGSIWIDDLSKFEAFNKQKIRTLFVANHLRVAENYTEAAEQYEVFVNTNPSTIETTYALYWAGWCYYKAASTDETLFSKSRAAFQSLINNYAKSPYALKALEKLRELDQRNAKNETHKAITAAENTVLRAEQSDGKSVAISEAIARLDNAKEAQERGNYEEALRLANDAQKTAQTAIDNHTAAKRYVEQGHNDLRQGRLESATQKAKAALRIDPSYQNANNLLEKIKQNALSRFGLEKISYLKISHL
ncbi:MAG: tetratricopeptide repeat protein [Candidatus Poribacteria bacterium]|nr:tetratricopeptide repeat protein [Candidatus Poribacteria bacterium]